jgi:hypothetical protein
MFRDTANHSACVLAAAAVLALTGCGDDPAATRPGPPSGGQEVVLDFSRYVEEVAPALARNNCSAGGDCHGAGLRGTFEMSPAGDVDHVFDFEQVTAQVDPHDRLASPLLQKPLAEAVGGTPHSHEPFADESDADFVVIRDWVLDGVVE